MKAIYKYELPTSGEIAVPLHSTLLRFWNQGDKIFGWFIVDLEQKETTTYKFKILATGEEFTDHYPTAYRGTVYLNCGLVFHIFDCKG